MSANIGWLFYRDYYATALTLKQKSDTEQLNHFDLDDKEKNKFGKNELLKKTSLPGASFLSLLELPGHNKTFRLKTTYPGLVIGTGYTHESKLKGEIKIGFFFDHTTGLPILPGSSVKGVLRSIFPGKSQLEEPHEQQQLTERKMRFLRTLLHKGGVTNSDTLNLYDLEAELFDGISQESALPITKRDIFGDAYPSVGGVDGKLLGTDFITPHGSDLTKDPTPIQMLKIVPGVTFTFQFRLTDGLINAEAKCQLFRQILLQLGAGAKTNVGYGRFENVDGIIPLPKTYYQPPSSLSLLPNQPPKPQDIPPQRTVNFSDLVPSTEQLTRPVDEQSAEESPLVVNAWYAATVETINAQKQEITVVIEVNEGTWFRKTKKLNAKQFIKFQQGDRVRVKLLNQLLDHLQIENKIVYMQLLLDTRGLVVKLRNRCFLIRTEQTERLISPHKVSSIAVTQGCLLSSGAIQLAVKHQIPIYFFDSIGDVQASLQSPHFSTIATVRRKQVYFSDSPAATTWVLEVFGHKNKQQAEVLRHVLNRRPSAALVINAALQQLTTPEPLLPDDQLCQPPTRVRATLLGKEGSQARAYWQAVAAALPEAMTFEQRSRRRATDPFNAALNYLYGMLYSTVEQALLAAGLDPYLGLFHADEYNAPTLAFDLIEPFRPWADRFDD